MTAKTTMDYSTWCTKAEAAAAIGVSPKTVEKFAADGELEQAMYQRPTGGPKVRVYSRDDVTRIAQQRHPEAAPFVMPPGATGSQALVVGRATPAAGAASDVGLALLAAIQRAPAPAKTVLTIEEASAVKRVVAGILAARDCGGEAAGGERSRVENPPARPRRPLAAQSQKFSKSSLERLEGETPYRRLHGDDTARQTRRFPESFSR